MKSPFTLRRSLGTNIVPNETAVAMEDNDSNFLQAKDSRPSRLYFEAELHIALPIIKKQGGFNILCCAWYTVDKIAHRGINRFTVDPNSGITSIPKQCILHHSKTIVQCR